MSQFVRRLLVVLFLLSFLLSGATTPVSAAPWQSKVDPWVLQTASQGETEFLVFLTTQADLSAAAALPTKLEKGTYVYETLTSVATRAQKGLIARLDELGVEYRPYWIVNTVWVRGSLSIIQSLAERPDVAHLFANPRVKLDEPQRETSQSTTPETIEWNITQVNAPQVWALGFTGQGMVIGGQDTGYDWTHPALKGKYRGWNGKFPDHNYNWKDATGGSPYIPVDPQGHGTHTMGTMVGDDGAGNQVGMAPGAQWIGCRNMDSNGAGTPETYIACYQWFVAPTRLDGTGADPSKAPDVINNSWGCPPSEGCPINNPNILLSAVQNLVAAGIVSAHSAGNSGSACSSVSEPAAIYDESFTVGATNSSDVIASFSSRGPVTVDGSNRPKPDISAPGVGVRSSIPGGGYASYSGTSMAGPHVAGLVALLLSAHPELQGQVAQIENIIQQSALHISWSGCSSSGVPNNAYGWGRIDALAAVQYSPHLLELDKVASANVVLPGDTITYTLTVTHSAGASATTNVVLNDNIPVGTTFVSATSPYTRVGDTVRWNFSSLAPQQSVNVDLVVMVNNTMLGTVTNANYNVHSDQVSTVAGEPVTTQVVKVDFLDIDKAASSPIAFPGGNITYTLTITNLHASIDTTGVVLTDTLPTHTTFVSTSLPYTQNANTLRWDIPSLAPLGTLNVYLVVQVDAAASGTIVNQHYAVRSDQMITVAGDPVVTQLETPASLELDKVASTSQALPGDLITYTLSFTNTSGVAPTTNVVLTDTIPQGTTFVSATLPFTQVADTIRWDFLSLAAQATAHVDLVVKVDNTTTGSVTNASYAVRSDQTEAVFGTPVTTQVVRLDLLALDKVASSPSAFPGGLITYTLNLTDTSALVPLTNLVLTDTIPAGTTFVSASLPYTQVGNTIRWDFPSLKALGTLRVDLVVRVNANTAGTITNVDYAARSDQTVPAYGKPVSILIGRVFFLPFIVRSP